MFKLLILVLLFFMYSCGSPRFAKEGVFVDDVDEYFNTRQDINVWLYGNFYPYKGLDRGVRLNSWYPQDKSVLKEIGFKKRNSKILFSAVPESAPYYHLIAIQHSRSNIKLQGFDRIEADSSYYFQKDFKMGRLDIRHVYIPYDRDNKGLSLVYYTSAEKHYSCPFCKLDYLARVNANDLQHKQNTVLSWQIFNCQDKDLVLTNVSLNEEIIKKYKQTYLKIYADYESSRGIQYFHIFIPKSNTHLELKLCPERYIVEWLDSKQQLLYSETLIVP